MKCSIEGFSQEYAVTLKKKVIINGKEVERKIDCTDLVILRWFVDFYPKMKKMEIDGNQYAWLTHSKMVEDLPIIDINKRAFSERLQKLVDFDILTYKLVKEGGTIALYGFGKNYINLVCSSEGVVRSNDIGGCVQTTYKDISIIDNKENYTKESQNRNEQPSPTPTFLQNTDDSITPKVRKGTANIVSNEDIEKYFETTYSIYPRKVNKQQAKKTYEHKFRGLSIVDAKNLANRIYKALQRQIALWQAENKGNGRELEYIPHFSSWLNDNIEDSKNFKKGR